MGLIATALRWEVILLLAGLFGTVAWKILTGVISLRGMLEADVPDANSPDGLVSQNSPGRVQALVISLFSALWYLLQVIHNPTQFPQVPDAMVAALGGSHGFYLSGKAYGLLWPKLRDQFKTGE